MNLLELIRDTMPPKKAQKAPDEAFEEMIQACRDGKLAVVKKYVTSGGEIDRKNAKGNTALLIAVSWDQAAIVNYLISKGANVNERNGEHADETALYHACARGVDVEIIKSLLDAGADLSIKDKDGFSPFYAAVDEENIEIVKYLLTRGADVHELNGVNNLTALFPAANNGNLDIANVLIDAGININAKDNEGLSAIYEAFDNKQIAMIKFLISKGADVNNQESEKGMTMLHEAIINGLTDIAKALIDAPDIDLNKKNKAGYASLYMASESNNEDIVKYLITHGANLEEPNGKPTVQATALHAAAYLGRLNIVKVLLAAGANPEIKSAENRNALEYASMKNRQDVVAYIKYWMTPKWKGFTKTDMAEFDNVLDFTGEEGYPVNATNYALCPVCHRYVNRSEACMYMSHNCSLGDKYYHKELYNKYKNSQGIIVWCTICGRICRGHNHYKLGLVQDRVPELILTPHDPYSHDCRDANGGGGLPEKITRFRRMREFALELQEHIDKMTDEEARTLLVEETWNAPFMRSLKVPKIMAEGRWNIPGSAFTPNAPPPPPPPPKPNVNDPSQYKVPKILVPGDAGFEGNHYATEYEMPVIVFTHKSKTGVEHVHPQITKEMLLTMVDNAGAEQGACFDLACKGLLWPREIQLAFEDPKMAPTVTPSDRERLQRYKERFNRWHAPENN